MKTPQKRTVIQWRCPNPVDIHVPALDPRPQHHRTSPPSITKSLASKVRSLKKLPDSALVHFRGRVGQVVVVSAAVQRQ